MPGTVKGFLGSVLGDPSAQGAVRQGPPKQKKQDYYAQVAEANKAIPLAERQQRLTSFAKIGMADGRWDSELGMHKYYKKNLKKIKSEVPADVFDALVSNIEALSK